MADCGVCIGLNPDEMMEEIDHDTAATDAAFHCCECSREFPIGTPYDKFTGEYEGEETTCRTCLVCLEIRDAFRCEGGFYYEALWESLEEVFDQLNTACFDRLQTVAAKKYLQCRWIKWKEAKC